VPMLSSHATLTEVWNTYTLPNPLTGAPSLMAAKDAKQPGLGGNGPRQRISEYRLFHDAVTERYMLLKDSQPRNKQFSVMDVLRELEEKRKEKKRKVAQAVKALGKSHAALY
jgi:hypothetical protein